METAYQCKNVLDVQAIDGTGGRLFAALFSSGMVKVWQVEWQKVTTPCWEVIGVTSIWG